MILGVRGTASPNTDNDKSAVLETVERLLTFMPSSQLKQQTILSLTWSEAQ